MREHLEANLSAYLDGELAGENLRAAEEHLTECAECRALLDDLRSLARHAQALDDRPPEHDLWAGIATRIAEQPDVDVIALTPRRRRFTFSVPQLAAAAVTLMAVSAGTVAVLMPRTGASVASVEPLPAPRSPGVVFASDKGVATYDAAIGQLELSLTARRGTLDTATVRVVEQSLRVIDQAIAQARSALARDPNNLYLNSHLQDALGSKLDLLRRVATLPSVS